MSWTGDALRDFNRHEAQRERRLKRFPKCGYCTQRIQDGYFYEINDQFVCEDCLIEHFRRDTDDYIN